MKQALASCEAGLRVQPENKALVQLRGTLKRAAAASQTKPSATRLPAGAEGQGKLAPQKEPAAADTSAKCPVSQLDESDVQDIRQVADAYQWQEREPSDEERDGLKQTLVEMFRNKYLELKARASEYSSGTALSTEQYEKDQKLGLQLSGGHRPMRRPDNVELPSDFREQLGVISLNELGRYTIENKDRRYLLSIYGNLFDVSDRPDKYGPDGPYASLTGKDLTWGLVAGVDTPEFCNRCYDLFKAKDAGKDKLAGICSWLAWYETEYGKPVGLLEPYTREKELPAPPLQEMESCTVM
uniref:Cytochrome b5 heme-binding domain-containing protein n=1 Tax=Alexandrium catenella TaxID=2925 RepID=A0A7S1WF31_ALECA